MRFELEHIEHIEHGRDGATSATSDSGDLTESTATSTTPSAGATALTVVMSDYAFTPKNATAAAGPITITAPNQGKLVHELVLIRTDLPLAKLPTDSAGDVNEDAFPESKRPGEISETQPGATGKVTVTLPAGRYVMLCNVAGHYKQGMVGNLVVR